MQLDLACAKSFLRADIAWIHQKVLVLSSECPYRFVRRDLSLPELCSLPLQPVYLSIHAPLSMVLLDIELELTNLWSLVLPSHPQTRFKKSVTFVAFHDFYKGNLSNKLHSTVSSSAIPYLSCFTACGWMPSGLGDLLLFILLYFFFFINPLLLALECETISHAC